MRMKLKDFEMALQQLDGFDDKMVKVKYEQYMTGWEIASRMLFTIESSCQHISGLSIADLGCGTGMLTIGAALLGASYVCGMDIDQDALDILKSNMDLFDDDLLSSVDVIQCDILSEKALDGLEKQFDVVIMNPPFGTKNNKGIDMSFLHRAIQMATKCVYSLHKSSTREHVLKKAIDWNTKAKVLAQLRFDLPAKYKFHKRSSVDIEVDLIQFMIQS